MKALKLEFYLESPALMTGVANAEENSSVTLPYVPGAAIRGAAIGAYLRGRPQPYDLSGDDEAHALFFEDQVYFLNGYPAYPFGDDRRALPVPRSWHIKKDEADNRQRTVYDFALHGAPQTIEKPKIEKSSFFWPELDAEGPALGEPQRRSTVHNGSDAPMIKEAGNSNVFRYEALEAGQRFIAHVLSEDEALLQELRDHYLPDGPLRLGGSKTGGYGLMRLKSSDPADWSGEYEMKGPNGWTVITLLSDAILLTEDGQPTTDLHDILKRALKRPDLPPPAVFAQTRLTGGFNRKWGLPLAQSWALAMGSVFAYRASDLSPGDLAEIVQSGIGLRGEEGFGRVGVNVSERAEFSASQPGDSRPVDATLGDSSKRLAQRMAQRRLLEEALAAIPAYTSKIEFDSQPENAQLSQLRIKTDEARRKHDLSLIPTHLNRLKNRSKEQFSRRRLRINGRPITWESWLTDRAAKIDALTLLDVKPETLAVAGQTPIADDNLKLDITCRLIDAVLRKAIKGK